MKRKQVITWIHLFGLNAFIYIAGVFYGPFISAYYVSKGISPAEIGTLLMIGPLAAIFVQPLWAKLSDRSGKRRLVLALVVAGSGLSMFLYYLDLGFFGYLVATICVTACSSSINPLSNALVIENAEKYDLSFATIRLGGTIGYALVAIWAGRFLKGHQEAQFVLSFCGYLVLMVLVLLLEEKRLEKVESMPGGKDKESGKQRKHWRISDIFTDKDIWFVLIFAFLSQVGLSFYSSFIGPFVLEKGFSQSEIGMMSSISAACEIPILLVINRVLKKYGTMKVLILSCFFVSLRNLLPIGDGLACVILSQMLQGVTYMTVFYACAMYIHDHVAAGCQSQGQSILSIVQVGIGAVTGNVLGGQLVEWLGYRRSYTVIAVLVAVFTVVIALIYMRARVRRESKHEV